MGDVRLVAVLLLTALVAGCADDAKPASRSSSSPSLAASTEPGGATTKAAGCTPRPRVTLGKRVPTVLYSLRFTVPPGRRKHGKQDATLYTYPEIEPGVFVTKPRHDVPDRGLIDAVLAKVPQGSPVLDGSRAWPGTCGTPGRGAPATWRTPERSSTAATGAPPPAPRSPSGSAAPWS
jgi:hypothetical protein